ncbi:MAG: hypothetical protein EOO02_10335 [Chitinophagaceae bacterium]|nr:MAG: hypothetical protein EOO02_10335 [Chitinophagaceae bacterium]
MDKKETATPAVSLVPAFLAMVYQPVMITQYRRGLQPVWLFLHTIIFTTLSGCGADVSQFL